MGLFGAAKPEEKKDEPKGSPQLGTQPFTLGQATARGSEKTPAASCEYACLVCSINH